MDARAMRTRFEVSGRELFQSVAQDLAARSN